MGRQGPGYISTKIQRDAIKRWADYRGIEIVEWFVDEDQSGGTQKRPGLIEAMRMIEAKEADGLACWRLNRFARNVSDAIKDVERIHDADAHLACVEEDIDPTGPFGTFILTVLLAVATLERDNAVAGFEEAKRRAVARGAYVSRTPFGYERVDAGEKKGTLRPHPTQGPIVVEAFRLAAGDSIQEAAKYLAEAVPDRRWTTTTTRRLLGSHSYVGDTRNGTLSARDTHDPLVSREVWEAAQTAPAQRQASEHYPLSGLLTCASCGGPMNGSRGGKGQRVYRCRGGETKGYSQGRSCKTGPTITAERVERYVLDTAETELATLHARISDPDADLLTLLERALHDAESELDQFAADLTMRRALGDRYHEHLKARVDAVEAARRGYREAARAANSDVMQRAGEILAGAQPHLLAAVLSGIFASIVVSPGRGLAVGERVAFVPLEDDGAARVAQAQNA